MDYLKVPLAQNGSSSEEMAESVERLKKIETEEVTMPKSCLHL
jgi:hypothetical protein